MNIQTFAINPKGVNRILEINFLAIILIVVNLFLSLPSNADPLRVALYVDRGASAPAKHAFRNELDNGNNIIWKRMYGDEIRRGSLEKFDALIVPGGSAREEAKSMGAESREEVRRFVKEGGVYLGVCAGAYLASSARESYLGMLPLRTVDQEHWHRVENGKLLPVGLTPLGMEVFGLKKDVVRIIYENGPIFAEPRENTKVEGVTPLGFYREEVVARGGERGVMLGAPIAVVAKYGRGIVLALSPHPEKTPGLKKIELHAIHWLYDHRDNGAK
jgi:glutamine amidotransferase-like uncharacterized protein